MIPNPFSEEDAQRYIAEFKSKPYSSSKAQLVYAGFRSGPGSSIYGNVRCYGCELDLSAGVNFDCDPLQTHLGKKPGCPIALKIKQRRLEIQDEIKQAAEEEKTKTLAQLAKQSKIHHEKMQARLWQHALQTQETRLLRFQRNKITKLQHDTWYLHSFDDQDYAEEPPWFVHYADPELLEAIEAALGERGLINGWKTLAIGDYIATPCSETVKVMVVKKTTVGTQDDGTEANSEATSDGIPTPGTSIADG
ncbi:MAG: hypothetical protein Q9226_003910 [Calogaya cf. arnoldii]